MFYARRCPTQRKNTYTIFQGWAKSFISIYLNFLRVSRHFITRLLITDISSRAALHHCGNSSSQFEQFSLKFRVCVLYVESKVGVIGKVLVKRRLLYTKSKLRANKYRNGQHFCTTILPVNFKYHFFKQFEKKSCDEWHNKLSNYSRRYLIEPPPSWFYSGSFSQ